MGGYAAAVQHKQGLKDQEFQDKHNEIQGMIDNLGTKLAAVPEDSRNNPDYLKMQDQLAQAIQSRDAHWKSIDQPNALTKFGKMLGKDLRFKKQETSTPVAPPVYGQPTMDVNGEKVPTGPAYKVQGPQTPAQMKAAAEASQLVAAAPLSPTQTAVGDAQAKGAGNLATMQATLKNIKTLFPNATPEQMATWQNELAQNMTGTKPLAEKYFSQLTTTEETLPDGTKKQHTWRVPMDPTAQPEEVNFDGQSVVPKTTVHPSTAQFNERLAAYAKDHGTTVDALPESAYSYVRQKMALESEMPSSNTNTTFKQDVNGAWVPVTETNQRTPGVGVKPVDPLGPIQGGTPTPGATPKPSGGGARSTTPKPGSAPKSGGPGNVHVGDPLFQGRTPAISKAQNDVVEATKLSSLADQVAQHPEEAINQKRLAVSLEKMSAGRFTTQALDYVIKSGWGNTLEQWANNPSTAALPKDVVKQLVDGAHENLKAAQDSLKTAVQGSGGADDGSGGKQKHYQGEVVKLKNGQTITIKVVHPDGSFE